MLLPRSVILSAALFAAASAYGANFYLVVPIKGSLSANEPEVTVALNATTLPVAQLKKSYSFDFQPLLQVTGDSAYRPSSVKWTVAEGALPPGLSFDGATIKGTPTEISEGADFTVLAEYKQKSGRNVYRIVVNGVSLNVTQIATSLSSSFSCAVTDAGEAMCWGFNNNGELGDGTPTARLKPGLVSGLSSGVVSITAGARHACALMSDTSVRCWGANATAQLGDGTLSERRVPVVTLPAGAAQVSAATYHTCAVMTSGGVSCWGGNDYGELGTGNNATALRPVALDTLTQSAVGLSTQDRHTCAVMADTSVLCWGNNRYGQLGVGDSTTRTVPTRALASGAVSVSTGGGHSCAVMANGTVMCWGDGYYGQLGRGDTTSTRAPVQAGGSSLQGIVAVSAGYDHTCAVSNSGTAWCWGKNSDGQLGTGNKANSAVPMALQGVGARVTNIAAGDGHTCAVSSGTTGWCWGNGGQGQLGNGTNSSSNIPVRLAN